MPNTNTQIKTTQDEILKTSLTDFFEKNKAEIDKASLQKIQKDLHKDIQRDIRADQTEEETYLESQIQNQIKGAQMIQVQAKMQEKQAVAQKLEISQTNLQAEHARHQELEKQKALQEQRAKVQQQNKKNKSKMNITKVNPEAMVAQKALNKTIGKMPVIGGALAAAGTGIAALLLLE